MKNAIEKIAGELRKILGPDRVISDPDILGAYSADETPDCTGKAELIVRPESPKEVSSVMKACHEAGVKVVPRGAGTGVTGGAVPVEGGVVLSLERMNRILEIDLENMIAVVEPGVITGRLQEALRAEGLLYPPDPASLDSCSIGGNVAENAGGPRAVKYGTTKDYVIGLEFVTPEGEIMTAGGKIVKNASGYNLIGILAGSEGTLAVITKIWLRLLPLPLHSIDALMAFSSIEEAIDAVRSILVKRIVPAAIEFMEKDAIDLVARHGRGIPYPDAGAHLLVQLDGSSPDFLHDELEKLSKAAGIDPDSVLVAESDIQRERLWKARRSIREAIRAESPVFLAEDCVVPCALIPQYLRSVKTFLGEKKLRSIMFGHAGDGNVHMDVLKGDMDCGVWKGILPEIKKGIYRLAIGLGGTITGEHGIGHIRKDYLPLAMSDREIELLRRIKNAFDPRGILNPGKIF
jgi:glycolate oxidase